MITLTEINELIDKTVTQLTSDMSKAEITERKGSIIIMARTIVLMAIIDGSSVTVNDELLSAMRDAIAA